MTEKCVLISHEKKILLTILYIISTFVFAVVKNLSQEGVKIACFI